VAVEEERVMAKKATEQRYARRAKLMNYARTLARSGEHADHKSIIAHLATLEGFEAVQGRFEDRAFLVQLDKLCALARGAAPELTSRTKAARNAHADLRGVANPETKQPA